MEHSFPKIYVEDGGLESRECIYEVEKDSFVMSTCLEGRRALRVFKKRIYEKSHLEVLDLEENVVVKSFILYAPLGKEYMLVESGCKVSIVEARGVNVFFYKFEGERVLEGDLVADEISKKGEVRSLKAPCNGVIVLIGDYVESPHRYLLVFTGEENVRRVSIRRG